MGSGPGRSSGERAAHRVLAVDDDPLMLDAYRRQFVGGDYQLSTASDGIQALAAIHRDPPDVVLLDLVLPHLDGLHVCREIRRHGMLDSVAVLVVTSRTESQLKIEALRAGASDYVTKPFEPEELDARVQAHLKTKVLRDEIRSMRERLVAGGKREAVIELAGAAAHEMNQPLTGILGRAALLDRKLEPDHSGRRDLEIIREQAERLGRCVARLARVSSYDTTEYVGHRRILDLEQASSAPSGAPAVLAVVHDEDLLETTRLAASAAGLSTVLPAAGESLAAAWDRSQAVALALELEPGQTAVDLVLGAANQLSSREIPAVVIDPSGGTMPSATIEHLGALIADGAPPSAASIERELRRAHRLGRLLRRLESRERELAAARTLDPLTGFARREHFVEALRSEVRRARRYGLDLGVAVFDVDDFTTINARWGEEVGNRVLRDLALVIRGCTREVDLLGRLGGELFGLVLPHTGAAESAAAADRMCVRANHEATALVEAIRCSVERASFGLASHELHLTISVGVASAGDPGALDPEDLLSRAELALHRAKSEGKNRVVIDRRPAERTERP